MLAYCVRENAPYIVPLVETLEDSDAIYLVTRAFEGRDLLRCMEESGLKELPEEVAKNIFLRVAMSLRFLHERNILHGNVSRQNILMSNKNVATGKAFLGGFGSAVQLSAASDTVIFPRQLRRDKCAPEIAKGMPAGLSSDIWDLGLLL